MKIENQHIKNIIELNIAVLLVSTSGVLGRYISMPPPVTIWMRCVIAAIILGLFCKYKKINLNVFSGRDWRTFIIGSIFLAAHWITYFYALQLSNVAIAMLSLFTYPVITALLEPVFLKSKLNVKHIILGLVVLVGIYFLTPELNFENNHTKGVFFGLISSVFYALRNLILKKKIAHYHGSMLMFYQLLIAAFFLWPVLFMYEVKPTNTDISALVTLALVTTAIGHTLFVLSFKNFSISAASIMSSIQPVYGILFAMLFLNEIPNLTTIFGGLLIVATVIIESLGKQR